MFRTTPRSVLDALAYVGCCFALLIGCKNASGGLPAPCDRIGDPEFTGPGRAVIGPAGGTVEAASDFIAGVRLEVAPGAWTDCREVRIDYQSLFETPNYPDGFVPFARPSATGSVRIEIGLTQPSSTDDPSPRFVPTADPLPFTLSFPIDRLIPAEALDVLGAFHYDGAEESWRIVLPTGAAADRINVATTKHGDLWSWGRVSVGEVDFEKYLRPAMEASFGAEAIAAMEVRFAELRADVEAQQWRLDCACLNLARSFLIAIRDKAAVEIDRIQESYGCGECNPLTPEFEQGMRAWWRVTFVERVLNFTDVMFPPKLSLELVAYPFIQLAQDALFDALKPDTPCNYDCYFEKLDIAMKVGEAVYYVADWGRQFVTLFGLAYMTPACPPQ